MAAFPSKLIKKEEIAQGTMAFHFEKPEGFSFLPGQHPTLRIFDQTGTALEHTFSFISTPDEAEVGFATRMSNSEYKTLLKSLEIGASVELVDPRGSMTLPNTPSRPIVYLAGGIGITPFMSIVRSATKSNSTQQLYLFYSNRTTGEAPFLDELGELAEQNKNFTFVPTMTKEDGEGSTWQGEQGYITAEMIQKYVPDVKNTIFYLGGPARFVSSMTELLEKMGVESIFIKSEDFGSYSAEHTTS